jgi:hypothetical protein
MLQNYSQNQNLQGVKASEFYQKLVNYLDDFCSQLKPDEDVALQVLIHGKQQTITLQNIGYYNPDYICIYGRDENRKPIQVIQHMSQLNILLTATSRMENSGEQQIGFRRRNF